MVGARPIGVSHPGKWIPQRETHTQIRSETEAFRIRYSRERYHRHSLRLPRHDYTRGGAYFVTLCTHGRECLFGQVVAGEMHLNELGAIAREEWERSSLIRPGVQLDAFIVMPNHLHGIVIMSGSTISASAAAQLPRAPRSLGSFIAGYKATTTKRINDLRGLSGIQVWQRNYHERIIADREGMNAAREYIHRNPVRWSGDRENPGRKPNSECEDA